MHTAVLLWCAGIPEETGRPAARRQRGGPKWCIRQVACGFLVLGALRRGPVLLGSTAMTLRVRALSDDEADELARMARSRTLLFALAHPRWEFVFQPKYAAYLNPIEPWWKVLRSLALKGRRFDSWAEVAAAVAAATQYWNAHRHP